jgi:hypothetical protein
VVLTTQKISKMASLGQSFEINPKYINMKDFQKSCETSNL